MRHYLTASLILVAVCLSLLAIPEASALPVSYNQTALNFGLTSVPRNSSSYDVFPLIPDNWLWMKFDNNTIDSGPLNIAGTVNYNTNLKALWSFQNVLTDSSTNGFTLTKATGTTTYSTGHEGQGLKFDTSTYYTASSSAIVTGTADRSVSYWIYMPSFANSPFPYSWGAITNNNMFGAFFLSDGTYVQWGAGNDINSNTKLSINTWYHIVDVLSNSGTKRTLYINGVQDHSTTTTALSTSSSSLNIASNAASPGATLPNGAQIDEFRIYNIALSQAQVSALDEGGKYLQSHTFDGGEYIGLQTTSSFANFEKTVSFSGSSWIKTTSNAEGAIFSKIAIPFNIQGYSFELNPNGVASGTIGLIEWDNSGLIIIRTITTINDGNWHYVNFVNTAGVVSIYIDGISQSLITSGSISGSIQNTGSLQIGARLGSVQLTGQLDNLKIYPYALSASQITSDFNSISPISSGKQFMSWYNGISGSSTLTKKLGFGSTTTLLCNLNSVAPNSPVIVSNMSNIYYECNNLVKKFDIIQNINSHVYTSQDSSPVNVRALFMGIKHIFSASSPNDSVHLSQLNSEQGNITQGGIYPWVTSNQEIETTIVSNGIKFNDNSTAVRTLADNNLCNINYNPSNLTKKIDSIACDQAIPAMAIKYWNGMNIQKIGGYNTNSTQIFLNSIDANTYKNLLSLPCNLLVSDAPPCITFILTDQTQTDYFIVLTSGHVYYGNAQTALKLLQNNNYALQSYDVITQATTSAFQIPNPILQSMTLYGFNLNTTVSKTGLFTLPSGYSVRSTIVTPSIRLIDPRWTNDLTDIPVITSTSSLFPIFLTASNAPSFSAIKVTSAQQILNNQEAVWAVAQLDSTRSVEFDLPAGTCANVYIADISVSPSVWNFEGIICATGVNQKTIAYTNTVPFTFYTLKYGVTDSYVPANNGLQTTFRTQAAPTTYTVIVRNSTGTVAINQTFTIPANQTIDTRTFNVSSVSKPASLAVSVGGNMVYSAYLGSSLSLATMASFFHQYFNYQGFDLISFIPIIFASMWTRNTIGAGMVCTVLVIATLSWLSVNVIPESAIYVAVFVACLGMIGYRSIYG